MKTIPHKDKGILNPKNRVQLFGVNFLVLQIALGLVREKRITEFSWGVYCLLRYQSKNVKNYKVDLESYDDSPLINIAVGPTNLVCRSLSHNGSSKIYAEYGQPGARLVYVDADCVNVYDPYKDDLGVYHIHDIINVESDVYLVSTGDSSKYLDEFVINSQCCQRVKRHFKHLGGFTASIKTEETIYLGTDFPYRPNYLLDHYTKVKYFLPKQAWLEYVIKMNAGKNGTLVIITKKLNHNIGHQIIFCTSKKIFTSAIKISIVDKETYATI